MTQEATIQAERMEEAPPGVLPQEYRGHCRRCDLEHRFANDVSLARATVDSLFHEIEHDSAFGWVKQALRASPGKMLGVAVVEAPDGKREILRAFSGELGGRRDWVGWVGPVLRRQDTADLETETLARIHEIERQMDACDIGAALLRLSEARQAAQAAAAQRREWYRLQRETPKDAARMTAADLEAGKRALTEAVGAGTARVAEARRVVASERARLQQLREERREASRVLSTALFDTTAVTNARGERRPLREIFAGARIVGGTADCAIPKLLEAANVARLRPVALAEAWWGPTLNGRSHGSVQGPCERKCKPILGHLLCGLDDH